MTELESLAFLDPDDITGYIADATYLRSEVTRGKEIVNVKLHFKAKKQISNPILEVIFNHELLHERIIYSSFNLGELFITEYVLFKEIKSDE